MKIWWGIATLAVMTVGCGGSQQSSPSPVFPVEGTVTYKGQPVVGADITFHHESSQRSAFGRTNDKGVYQLTTFSANDGAVDGKHGVTIVQYIVPTEVDTQPDIESEDYQPPGYGKPPAPVVAPKTTLPKKYESQGTSGLIAVVNTNAANEIDFELTD